MGIEKGKSLVVFITSQNFNNVSTKGSFAISVVHLHCLIPNCVEFKPDNMDKSNLIIPILIKS